jgi:redox-sensitive bicupin YhaK (pirin superfamily)
MTTTPRFTIRRAGDRGHANHGWLDAWHSFSFGDYYDPEHLGFRSLRVINEDTVAAGGGFPDHPHRDMEIFSYLLGGSLAHRDSLGNQRVLKPGEIQLMRAGSGIVHAEFNPSATEPAHLLQIWITPHTRGLTPAYVEWTPAPERQDDPKTLVLSADGRDGSAVIAQDAAVYLLKLSEGQEVRHCLAEGRGLWLHIARGAVSVNGISLAAGDAAALEEPAEIRVISTAGPAEAILFDLG